MMRPDTTVPASMLLTASQLERITGRLGEYLVGQSYPCYELACR